MSVCWILTKQYYETNRSCVSLNRLIYLAKSTNLYILTYGNEFLSQDIPVMKNAHIYRLVKNRSIFLKQIIFYFKAFFYLRIIHKKYKINILYTNASVDWLFGVISLFFIDIKWLIDFDEHPKFQISSLSDNSITNSFKRAYYTVKNLLLRATVQYADCVIAQGVDLESGLPRRLLEESHVKEEKILPLPIGVDFERLLPKGGPYRVKNGQLKLIYSGYLSRWRGIDKLLLAMEKLCITSPEIRLILVGPFKDKNEEIYLKRLIAQLGLIGRDIYQGHVAYDRALELTMNSDVCVCPFPKNHVFDEAYALKIPEYLAMGKPVVATDLASIRPYIKNGLSVTFLHNWNSKEILL